MRDIFEYHERQARESIREKRVEKQKRFEPPTQEQVKKALEVNGISVPVEAEKPETETRS